MPIRTAILTISDSTVAGTRKDLSGPALESKVAELHWTVVETGAIADERAFIAGKLKQLVDSGNVDLILTTGGTGLAARDVTPEATRDIADREVPGFGELMRAEGLKKTKLAPLSRGGASTSGKVLILNLPGSPKGAIESLEAVTGLVPHAVDLLKGRTEHKPAAS